MIGENTKKVKEEENKAGYTVNMQSLAGEQGQYTEGQGQSVGRGCILGGQGLLCSKITNMVNFGASEIRRYGHSDRQTDLPRDTPSYRVA